MPQLKVFHTVKVVCLSIIVIISFSFVVESVLNLNIIDTGNSQLASTIKSSTKEEDIKADVNKCNRDASHSQTSPISIDNENLDTYNALGSGTGTDPFRIYNHKQLRSMAMDVQALDDYYIQCKDIDLTGTYSSARPYFIIGSNLVNFTGSYNGNQHSIINFEYRENGPFFEDPVSGIYDENNNLLRNSVSYAGLFGSVLNARIKSLELVYPRVVIDGDYVGSLVGFSNSSNIGDIVISKPSSLPALTSSIIQGKWYVGGIVGQAYNSNFFNIRAVSRTQVSGKQMVGGVVGLIVSSSLGRAEFLSGDITANSSTDLSGFGGLVGVAFSSNIKESYSNARVSIGSASSVGGFAGTVGSATVISNSYATGQVSGHYSTGGFAGHMSGGEIRDSYAKGNVFSTFSSGGFVGTKGGGSPSNIYRSYSTGQASGLSSVGGFVGAIQFNTGGTITDSYTTSKVSGLIAGGFAGGSYLSTGHNIINSYSSGDVGGAIVSGFSGTTRIGGFIGVAEDSSSYSGVVTTSKVILVPGVSTQFGDYGKFIGSQLIISPQEFDNSYFYAGAGCPVGCNTIGNSVNNLSTLTDSNLSLAPFNWVFDSNGWEAVTGLLPILPNAGF